MNRYFIIYKPYLVLSQFSSIEGKKTLSDYFNVPKDVYPVGRLDYDSEGLLILTNDTRLNSRLLSPANKHEREYWVQVEGEITNESLGLLRAGVDISIDGKNHATAPCKANRFITSPTVPDRDPPIRYRAQIPTSWISLILTEGKNRQVRRMTAKVGFPTLRLIRYRIESITLEGLHPGEMVEMQEEHIYNALFGKKNELLPNARRLPRKR